MYELIKGLSDLPISLTAFVFAYLLREQKKYRWAILFLSTGFAALLGALLHSVALPMDTFRIVWCILYMLLYAVGFLLFRQLCRCLGILWPRHPVYILSIVLWICSVCLRIKDCQWDIYVFAFYAVVLIVPVAIQLFTHRDARSTLKWMLLLLVFAVLCQIFKRLLPFGVIISHCFIFLSLFFGYLSADE